MDRASTSITLELDSLRALGSWAADCAERALPVYERQVPADARPRAAIEGLRAFASGGKRTAGLRSLAWAAYAAAGEAGDPAAAAAARAASLAAAVAYTHPLATAHQTKHLLCPPAYAALAWELAQAGDPEIGHAEIRWAIERSTPEVQGILRQLPARQAGKGRLDVLLHELDGGVRSRIFPQGA